MQDILQQFGIHELNSRMQPFGNGLINHTWLITTDEQQFVLQKINHQVFKTPADIAFNINLMASFLQTKYPSYLFVSPIQSITGEEIVVTHEGYFRLFPFIKASHTIDVVEKPDQAFEASKQFARFTKHLAELEVAKLKITLPDFHNLPLRFKQFQQALLQGNKQRIAASVDLIDCIKKHYFIVDEFVKAKQYFTIRVTHHDTKISNVLFDASDKGICVIDLDTVMPGYFISDVGDMMRTYLCPVSEEEKDFSSIIIRKEFYQAIVDGYGLEMGDELSTTEKKYFHYAGQFMIYMQAIRFLTDHINDDIYYGSKYEGHNFVRAGNQITLLQRLIEFIP